MWAPRPTQDYIATTQKSFPMEMNTDVEPGFTLMRCLCPPCAVYSHEGCIDDGMCSAEVWAAMGGCCIYTNFMWIPRVVEGAVMDTDNA